MFYCQECAQRYGLTITHIRYPHLCDFCHRGDYCVFDEEAQDERMDNAFPIIDSCTRGEATLEAS